MHRKEAVHEPQANNAPPAGGADGEATGAGGGERDPNKGLGRAYS